MAQINQMWHFASACALPCFSYKYKMSRLGILTGEIQVIWVFIRTHLSINFQVIVTHKAFVLFSLNHNMSKKIVLFSGLIRIQADSLSLDIKSRQVIYLAFQVYTSKFICLLDTSSQHHPNKCLTYLRYGVASNNPSPLIPVPLYFLWLHIL